MLLLLLEGLAEDLGADGGGHKLLLLGLVALGGTGATTLPGVGHTSALAPSGRRLPLGCFLEDLCFLPVMAAGSGLGGGLPGRRRGGGDPVRWRRAPVGGGEVAQRHGVEGGGVGRGSAVGQGRRKRG